MERVKGAVNHNARCESLNYKVCIESVNGYVGLGEIILKKQKNNMSVRIAQRSHTEILRSWRQCSSICRKRWASLLSKGSTEDHPITRWQGVLCPKHWNEYIAVVIEIHYTHHCRKRVHLVEKRPPLTIHEAWRVCTSHPLSSLLPIEKLQSAQQFTIYVSCAKPSLIRP